MQSFLFAKFAEFLELQAFFGAGIIFAMAFFGLIIQIMANHALQVYESLLGHINKLKIKMLTMNFPAKEVHGISRSSMKCWSQWSDSDRRPAVYKTAALTS